MQISDLSFGHIRPMTWNVVKHAIQESEKVRMTPPQIVACGRRPDSPIRGLLETFPP
jgi:hypothetical protein